MWSAESFSALHFVKICFLKSKWCQKARSKLLCLSDSENFGFAKKVACLLWKLGGIREKINKASTVQLSTLCTVSRCGFSSRMILGTKYPQIPRVYLISKYVQCNVFTIYCVLKLLNCFT
jgi:hypothetical protein